MQAEIQIENNELKTALFLYDNNLFEECLTYIKSKNVYENPVHICSADFRVVEMMCNIGLAKKDTEYDYYLALDYITNATLIELETFKQYITQYTIGYGLTSKEIWKDKYQPYIAITPPMYLYSLKNNNIIVKNELINKYDSPDLFEFCFKLALKGNPKLEDVILELKKENLTPDQLRRIEGFIVKYSIVISNFDKGYDAIKKLIEYRILFGETNVDIHSIVSEFISYFLTHDIYNIKIQEIMLESIQLLENTPSELYMSLNQYIKKILDGIALNKIELTDVINKFETHGYSLLPHFTELKNILEKE